MGELSVAILAGGQSRRMGTDKALLRLAPNSPTLLERVLQPAMLLAVDVFVIASHRPGYEQFGVRVLPDLYFDAAVLGGIGSALRYSGNNQCLVLSCDHPFLSVSLLRAMAEWPGDWQALVPVTMGESRQGGGRIRHPLHAVYDKGCLPAIEQTLALGERRATSFYPRVRVEEIAAPALQQYDPNLLSLMSINTPEALAAASSIVATRG